MAKRDVTRKLRWMRENTEQRRNKRSKRHRTFIVGSLIFCVLCVVALPSLLCQTQVVHSIVASQGNTYGWKITAQSVGIGWITPLQINQLEAVGPSGKTIVVADSLHADLTVLDFLRGYSDIGNILIDSPRLETVAFAGGSELENDLQPFFDDSSESAQPTAHVELRNGSIKITDVAATKEWRADQVQATAQVGDNVTVDFNGVLTAHDAISGALQAKLNFDYRPGSKESVRVQLDANGLPLSLLELVTIRVPQSASQLPQQWSGNATGQVGFSVGANLEVSVASTSLEFRNFVVMDPRITGTKPWRLGQASIQGKARLQEYKLQCENVAFESDAGRANLHGQLDLMAISNGRFIDALLGQFQADVDLAVLTHAVPGLLPLRTDAEIQRGRVAATIQGDIGNDNQYRSYWNLTSQPITATVANGANVVLEPIAADVILVPTANWISADRLDIQSSFGIATARGDLRQGEARFDLDFGQLANLMGRVLDLPNTTLSGSARGQLAWSANGQQQWQLTGSASGDRIVVQLGGGPRIIRPKIQMAINATGIWRDAMLQQLSSTQIMIEEPKQRWQAILLEAVDQPTSGTLLPMQISGSGELTELADWFVESLPTELAEVNGHLEADCVGAFSLRTGVIERAQLTLRDVAVVHAGRRYEQSSIKAIGVGEFRYPNMSARCQSLTVSGNAIAFAAQGDISPHHANMEVAYRCDLSRLQGAVQKNRTALGSILNREEQSKLDDAWKFHGNVEGIAVMKRSTGDEWLISVDSKCRNIRALQPPKIVYTSNAVGPVRASANNVVPREVWSEPTLNIKATLATPSDLSLTRIESLIVETPWLECALNGQIKNQNDVVAIDLEGPTKLEMMTVARRVSSLVGQPIAMLGSHQTNLKLKVESTPDSEPRVAVDGTVGWNQAELAGVRFGPSVVPFQLNETTLRVNRAALPLDQGQLNVDGELHFRPSVVWFEQKPGRFAEGVRLTPEMCRSWLQYLMPIAANATALEGSFSVDLAECVVIPSDPVRSRVRGTLHVEQARLGPGPLANTMITTVRSVEMAAKGLVGQTPVSQPDVAWLQLIPQSVDFAMLEGRVSHQRLRLRSGNVDLISSGAVNLNGQLGMVVEVPLNTTWLGSDLTSLAGQQLSVPIGGTLSQPKLDTRSVSGILGNLGAQAVQSTAENYLQRQLDKQLKRLLGN